jgi:hypothetical protein
VKSAHILYALLWASAAAGSSGTAQQPQGDVPELWFPVGEQLVYRIYWGFIPVGTTRVVTEWIEEDGRRLLAIRYRTRSNKVIATIYPVDDHIESVIDPVTFRPVRFTKNLKEGRHRYHEITTFDYERGMARWESKIKDKVKEYPIQEDTRDLVSFLYYMRSKPLSVGKTGHYRVMADEKIYDLSVRVLKKEKVKLPRYGRVASLKMEPQAKFQGLFVRKGKMTVWASDDDRYIVTRISATVPVASVKVVLCGVSGPGDDFWVRKGHDPEACDEEAEAEPSVEPLDPF